MDNATPNTKKVNLKRTFLKLVLLALLLLCCILPVLTVIYKNRFTILSVNPHTLTGGTGVTGRSLSIALNDAPLFVFELIPGGYYPTPNQIVIAVPQTDMDEWYGSHKMNDLIYYESLPSSTKMGKVDGNGYYYIPAVSGELVICFMSQGRFVPEKLVFNSCVRSNINKDELLIADYEKVNSMVLPGPEITCNKTCTEVYNQEINELPPLNLFDSN